MQGGGQTDTREPFSLKTPQRPDMEKWRTQGDIMEKACFVSVFFQSAAISAAVWQIASRQSPKGLKLQSSSDVFEIRGRSVTLPEMTIEDAPIRLLQISCFLKGPILTNEKEKLFWLILFLVSMHFVNRGKIYFFSQSRENLTVSIGNIQQVHLCWRHRSHILWMLLKYI